MPIRYGRLLRWHFVFCVFYYQVQDLLADRSWDSLQQLLDPTNLLLTLIGFVIMFSYAFLPYLAVRKFYERPWYELVAGLVVAALVAVGFRYLMEEVLSPVLLGFRNYPVGTSLITYFLDNLYYLILHGATGIMVFLLQLTQFRESQRQALAVENQKTELAFLRSQINPHFLFNTLNNVYSLFFQQSDKALKVIERLTVMLRYGLYEKAEKVPLQKELEHLTNFIELEKIRYDFETNIQLALPTGDPDVKVPPLILITFVENAFKHGNLRQPLVISLKADKEGLDFKVANSIKQQQKDQVGGIGLGNLKKRLALIYGADQSIKLTATDSTYTAHLTIKHP
jgi:sensor histidine kinase YesM